MDAREQGAVLSQLEPVQQLGRAHEDQRQQRAAVPLVVWWAAGAVHGLRRVGLRPPPSEPGVHLSLCTGLSLHVGSEVGLVHPPQLVLLDAYAGSFEEGDPSVAPTYAPSPVRAEHSARPTSIPPPSPPPQPPYRLTRRSRLLRRSADPSVAPRRTGRHRAWRRCSPPPSIFGQVSAAPSLPAPPTPIHLHLPSPLPPPCAAPTRPRPARGQVGPPRWGCRSSPWISTIGRAASTIARPPTTIARPNDRIARPPTTIARPNDRIARPNDRIARPPITIAHPNDRIARPNDTHDSSPRPRSPFPQIHPLRHAPSTSPGTYPRPEIPLQARGLQRAARGPDHPPRPSPRASSHPPDHRAQTAPRSSSTASNGSARTFSSFS